MRIKLVDGKQRELVELAKGDKNWRELSGNLDLSIGYLRTGLRKEETLLSGKVYRKLCKISGVNYDEYVERKLNDNWGRSKGGKNSAFALAKEIKIPGNSIELAEFYGIMLGDGNLTKQKGYKIGTYQIRIAGDSRYDKKYLLNYVRPLIENLFSIEVSHFKQKNKNAYYLSVTGRRLVEFMESKGFKPGNKIQNRLEIPDWIKQNRNLLKSCLRGIYDTDGGIYKLNNQSSVQIVLTNYNSCLLRDVKGGFDFFGHRGF